MMRCNSIQNNWMFMIFFSNINTNFYMASFNFMVNCFTNIMK